MSDFAAFDFLGLRARAAGKPLLLDLYCAAGGAAKGYMDAGFYVVGVDINRQPKYIGNEFIQGDCIMLPAWFLVLFDAIHASPPCQIHTRKTATWGRKRVHWPDHKDLIPPTRDALERSGKPWVMENVMDAPMRCDVMLCGTMFGLRISKHRQFELSFPIAFLLPSCDHSDVYNPWSGKGRSAKEHREAQGTPWIPQCGGASRKAGVTGDLNNAIPPAYTEWLGAHLMHEVNLRKTINRNRHAHKQHRRHPFSRGAIPMTTAPSDMSVTPDSREPRSNPRQPIFRDHNCWKCREGERPCAEGNYNCCSYPHARND